MANRRAPRGSDSREAVAEERQPRESDTREHEVRFPESYTPPSALPTPAPQDGYVFLWVRTSMLNVADDQNISARLQEGWEPVKLSDHPELMLPDTNLGARFTGKGYVEVGGLMLCKMDAERARQRSEYYANVAKSQMASVDNNMFNETPKGAPMGFTSPERKTRTQFGPDTD